MSNLFQPMTATQWDAKEQYYADELAKIVLPDEPLPIDIKNIEAQLDVLFGQARLDMANCKRQMERIDRRLKTYLKEAYLAVKDNGKTDKEKEALAAQYVRVTPADGMSMDLYTALDIAEHRFYFMEGVIDILKTKHERCITDSGMLKIEENLQK